MDMYLDRRRFLLVSGAALAVVAQGNRGLAALNADAAQQTALACTWGGYADTDLNFTEFFGSDHTLAARFMLQYPNAYTGPMVSVRGSGTYLIGQGDVHAAPTGTKLVVRIGDQAITHQANLSAATWHHIAVVRMGTTVWLYLDGAQVGIALTIPGTDLPEGTLRLGKTNDATAAGGVQFYGLLDDVAVFTTALSATEIAQLAAANQLSGSEAGLLAGYVFDEPPAGGLPATLSRPVTRSPAALLRPVSSDRNSATDAAQLPLALTGHKHLPVPADQAWQVIQGVDNADPSGSHRGYASFCWDLMLAGLPQSASEDKPFHAAAPGTVAFVKEDAAPGGATNFITVAEEPGEFGDYLHLSQSSAVVAANDRVNDGQHLADVGDTGAAVGAYHLHFATTNLGESRTAGAFVTIPAPFSDYEASDDQGTTWYRVLRGIPLAGQWVRRAAPTSSVRYSAVWRPSTEGEIRVDGWAYEDYRAKYDELWPQGWRLKLIAPYVVDGQVLYTAVWQPSTEGEIQVDGWTYEDYRSRYDVLWELGWRLTLIAPYAI
jgi:murein DD-endopeptidase MepM/ murein hydrolase activator NlpD